VQFVVPISGFCNYQRSATALALHKNPLCNADPPKSGNPLAIRELLTNITNSFQIRHAAPPDLYRPLLRLRRLQRQFSTREHMCHNITAMNLGSSSISAPIRARNSRAWYEATITNFFATPPDAVLGCLQRNAEFATLETQAAAWVAQVEVLREALVGIEGQILLEFEIPRMGRRIDAVVITRGVLLAIEFKVGSETFDRSAIEQVWDYSLDLKNFHEASHNATIIPVLVATDARGTSAYVLTPDHDQVYRPIRTNAKDLRAAIVHCIETAAGIYVDGSTWAQASYKPTPTIIEAARALYANHSVDAIARYDAGAQNLRLTSSRIDEIVDYSLEHNRKSICFVTGVPGAGKTLVGLNLATRHRREVDQETPAVFLSGNQPLVSVLVEALARDEVKRKQGQGETVRKGEVRSQVKQFIQNVHHFRDTGLADLGAPWEHVVIFDEAQRAWDLKQTASFMQRKKKLPGFNQSEPEFLISYMDRHDDWSVIICLVGGGQEINTGEAGINGWLTALENHFPKWDVYVSERLTDSEYAAIDAVRGIQNSRLVTFDDSLHLSVSMRSFRAENVSAFVKALLDYDVEVAKAAYQELAERYPIAVTRNLDRAKEWIRSKARGSERYGLVASSKALRLKPLAIDIRVDVDPIKWFLNNREDVRSSYYLEDAATEFQVQGLELDWACVTWDGDFRKTQTGWSHHDFRGTSWCRIHKIENQNYLRNAYRVLLTRARQGMVIFVPQGDKSDPTRTPAYYDSTFHYLSELGLPTLT